MLELDEQSRRITEFFERRVHGFFSLTFRRKLTKLTPQRAHARTWGNPKRAKRSDLPRA